MTEDEIRQMARNHGWDDVWNTGKTLGGYQVYHVRLKQKNGAVLTTGEPTFVLVKDDEVRGPADDDEYDEVLALFNEALHEVRAETEREAA